MLALISIIAVSIIAIINIAMVKAAGKADKRIYVERPDFIELEDMNDR